MEALLEARMSANKYDPKASISDAQIEELVRLAGTAPSAFNAQNWRFIAVRSQEAKERLLPLAYQQQKVFDAAVTFIVCGVLEPHASLPQVLKPSLERGIFDRETYDRWIDTASGMYRGNPALQRDEAIRSASLAAMTLMLAAQSKGLASGPLIGFDLAGVSAAFGLLPTEIAVMMVAVGRAAEGNWPQKPRRPVAEILAFR